MSLHELVHRAFFWAASKPVLELSLVEGKSIEDCFRLRDFVGAEQVGLS